MKFKRRYQDSMQYTYKINTDTGAYLVEVRLDDYEEMFRGWDASPAVHREMDPELLRFIEESGFEIDLNEQIEFIFFVEEKNRDDEKEVASISAIRNNFRMAIYRTDRILMKNRRKILMYVLISLLFLIASYTVPTFTNIDVVFQIFVQGLFVGGWVFLWEAFSLFFFVSHDVRQKRKRYVKFMESAIAFKYVDDVKPSV